MMSQESEDRPLNKGYAGDHLALGLGRRLKHSIFETLKVTDKGPEVPFFHWERMRNGGRILGIDVPEYPVWLQRLQDALREIEQQTPEIDHRTPLALKVVLSQRTESSLEGEIILPSWEFTVRKIPYTADQYRKGVWVIFLDEVRRDRFILNTVKSADYLDTGLALRNLEARGAFEGLWHNQRGDLMEGTRSNIFLVQGGTVCTPSKGSGCLKGTRRRVVRELCLELAIPYQERAIRPEELFQAEEIFLTNALMGIMPANRVEDTPISMPSAGGITAVLMEKYREFMETGESITVKK